METGITIRKPANAVSLPDNDQWDHRFEVYSETSSRVYVVARNKSSKKWACSCPGWISHRHCKHLTKGCGLTLAEIHGANKITETPKRKKIR